MSVITCAGIASVVTCGLGQDAMAEAATKVGWWSNAAALGIAAPAPDTPPGGMRVSVASEQTLSFGALELRLARDESGTLTLSIARMTGSTAHNLNTVVACPTTDDRWKPGDNQDGSTAPKYDCGVHSYPGHLSADGSSMTFLVDGSADVRSGVLSLAIVPRHTNQLPGLGTDSGSDLTPPFAVDFDKPEGDTLITTGGQAPTSQPSELKPAPTEPGRSGSPANGSAGTSSVGVGTLPPSSMTAPSTANVDQPPVVASQSPASPTTLPQALQRDAGLEGNKRNLLLLLFVLLGAGAAVTRRHDVRQPRSLLHSRVGDFDA